MIKGSLKKKKQALRKFSETAKGWYWNIGKLHRKYTVKLYMLCTGVQKKMSFYQILISEMKRSGKGQNITLTWSELNS